MKHFVVTAACAGALGAAALGLAGTAAAAGGADAAINGLKSEGYTVQINGPQSAPLTACSVTGVKKDAAGNVGAVAYVDIACPDGC